MMPLKTTTISEALLALSLPPPCCTACTGTPCIQFTHLSHTFMTHSGTYPRPNPTLCWSPSSLCVQRSQECAPTVLAKRIIACLDVRSNDQGDLVVTKGDQYDVREKEGSLARFRNPRCLVQSPRVGARWTVARFSVFSSTTPKANEPQSCV